MNQAYESFRLLTDANLEIYLSHYLKDAPCELREAVRYSVLGRGKRVRPTLVFLTAKAYGIDEKAIMPLAIALELIHNYSLVHDDLPAMDNDDYRSGQLSTHKKFGEATGILAGDTLLTMAGEILADDLRVRPEHARSASFLFKSAGASGMVGGQILDLKEDLKEDEILKMYALKTGALFKAAILMPAYAAAAAESEIKALDAFASYTGLSFQIADDVIDLKEGETKKTFASIHGIEEAEGTLKTFRVLANKSLDLIPNRDFSELKQFTDALIDRSF